MRKIIYALVAIAIVIVFTFTQRLALGKKELNMEKLDVQAIQQEISERDLKIATEFDSDTYEVERVEEPKLYVSETLPNMDDYVAKSSLKGYRLSQDEFETRVEEGTIRFKKQNPGGVSEVPGGTINQLPDVQNQDGMYVESVVNEVDTFMNEYNTRYANIDGVLNTYGIEQVGKEYVETEINIEELIIKYRGELRLPVEPEEFNITERFGIRITDNQELPTNGYFEVLNGIEVTTKPSVNTVYSIYNGTVIEKTEDKVSIDYGDVIVEFDGLENNDYISGTNEVIQKGAVIGTAKQSSKGASIEIKIKDKDSNVYINPLLFYQM